MIATPRVALVTGSTSGIGAAIADRLEADGLRVIRHGRTPGPGVIAAELADEAARVELVAEAASRWGRLDVLVNNAGISGIIAHADLAAASPAVWRTLHEVNVIAPFHLIAEAAPFLRREAGCIVNVSSHAGVRPKGASIPYAVTKAALNHMTRLLAVALAPDIRVNAVAPGLVDTPLTAEWAEARALWRERAPMLRPARPDDVANVVSFLIGSDYLTGEVVVADGGLNLT